MSLWRNARAVRALSAPPPVGGKGLGLAGLRGISPMGMTGQMEAFGEVPTLFAIVDKIASSAAAAEWELRRKPSDEPVERHAALQVLNKPNNFYTRRAMMEAILQHYDLTGEMWLVVVRSPNGKLPLELWPVRPDRMTPVPSSSEFIAGYVYKNGNVEIPLSRDDVIFVKRQNPIDPYRGISPVGSLLLDLEGEKAAATYNAMFFRNGAKPGGILEVDEFLSDAEFDKMVTHWREQHQGVQNAHRVAVLERAKFKEMSYTNKDMEFTGLRQFSKEQIRQAYGFPKPILGDVTDVNRANAEAAEVTLVRWTLNPRLNLIKEALNTQFLPMFGATARDVEFDYEDPAPEDREGEREERNSLVANAVALINVGFDPVDVMDKLGLPEIRFIGGGTSEPQ